MDCFCLKLISGQPFQRRFFKVFQNSNKLCPHPTLTAIILDGSNSFELFLKKSHLFIILVHIPAIGFNFVHSEHE